MNKLKKFQRENITFRIIWFFTASSAILKISGSVTLKPPKMQITQYILTIWRTTKLEHNTDFVVHTNIKKVDVTCVAEYPITFKFPYPQNAKEIARSAETTDYRISNWKNQAMTPVTTEFKRMIKFHLGKVNFLSLNITCGPVDQNIQISEPSVHLYWKGQHSIENQGHTLHISAKPSKNLPLVLPCRPANPNLNVVLEKDTANKSSKAQKWKLVNLSENYVTFAPKVGFTFRNDGLDEHVFGLYRCLIDEDTKNPHKPPFVILNVTKSTSISSVHDLNFVPRSKLVRNARAGLDPPRISDMGDWFKCCSGKDNTTIQMYLVESQDPINAQVARASIINDIAVANIHHKGHNFRRDDCYFAHPSQESVSVFVVCQGKNVDFVEEFINVFHPMTTGPVTNRSKRILKDKDLYGSEENSAKLKNKEIPTNMLLSSTDLKTAPVSQKIMVIVLRHFREESADKLSNHSQLLCDKQVLSTSEKSHPINGKLTEYDRDFYYEGEEMIFMCLGGKMFYAVGGYLRLNWKNGTKNILKPKSKDFTTMPCSGPGSKVGIGGKVYLRGKTYLSYKDSTAESKFGTALADPEMVSVECWMPRGDGVQWDKISKNLTIKGSTALKFAEMENEVVNFSKGEKWKMLTCIVEQGQPQPMLTVTKDGRPLKKNISQDITFESEMLPKNDLQITVMSSQNENSRKVLSAVITFQKIKNIHRGVYECKASNSYKTVTRTIKVSVTDNPNTTNKATLT